MDLSLIFSRYDRSLGPDLEKQNTGVISTKPFIRDRVKCLIITKVSDGGWTISTSPPLRICISKTLLMQHSAFLCAEDVLQGGFLVRPDSLRHVFLIRNPSYTYRITRKVAWDRIRRFLSFRPVSYVPYSKNPRIRT